MIGFWLVAAALTALALLPLLRTLLRPSPPLEGAAEFARGVYAAQVTEIDRDLKRGILSVDQARAARAEVGRRLLSVADEAAATKVTSNGKPAQRTAMVVTLLLPLAALGIYLPLGHPNLPAVPFATRPKEAPVPPQVIEAVAKLEEALKANPDDAGGWALLAQSYGAMSRPNDAVNAWRQVLRLTPADASVKGALAEALTVSADGVVGEEAVRLFTEAVAANAMDARARYYLGMARLQAGDIRGALDRWTALVADSPADAPWLPTVRERIHDAATQVGLDPFAITPQPRPASAPPPAMGQAGGQGGAAPALSPEQMQAMAGMSKEDQQATINSMVDGLEAKLKDNPGDADGWMRLARAREVQGNLDAARAALRGAVKADPKRLQAWLDLSRLTAPDDEQTQGSPEFLAAMGTVLNLAPDNPQALYYLGQQAANEGKIDRARELWGRLLKQLPADAPQRPELQRRMDNLK
ncbi:c-type cytochrome biogenesis protein CcmI [Niveispirillum lacus]|uniref:C-type cytochrome biogenesis protein CcmI n=1 Tax=Niveispirillum lacus TaxID=1981099 RepID=A0A255Z166_9PROT|nr:c-type cytochrome biogenesis protein CcmI [Niveispirillum lacus]OYQ35243.1 c-type cytochrome biogenesis protein CcmI [Niveispirillum lacus]